MMWNTDTHISIKEKNLKQNIMKTNVDKGVSKEGEHK